LYSCYVHISEYLSVKKTIYILFISVYFALTVGMTLSMHFCGETITSVQVIPFDSKNDVCGCDHTSMSDDCCKTEIKSIQLKDVQISVQAVKISSPQPIESLWAEIPTKELYSSNFICATVSSHFPTTETPSFILNRVLLI